MPSLATSRAYFQVVWLGNGQIFAIGGYNGKNRLNTVEELNREWGFEGETTQRWRKCGSMFTARSDFTAVVLHQNIVFVAGGDTINGDWLEGVEIFTPPVADDPRALGQWTVIQPMPSPPEGLCSGVFSNGAVFIFGMLFSSFLLNLPQKVCI